MNLPSWLAAAAAIPAVVSVLVGVGLHVYIRVGQPPVPQTVGEAVVRGSEMRLLQLIDAGADPKLPVRLKLPDLAGGRLLRLTPLAIAAVKGDDDSIRVLTRAGEWSEEEKREASCLAAVSRHESLARRLVDPVPSTDVCARTVEGLAGG